MKRFLPLIPLLALAACAAAPANDAAESASNETAGTAWSAYPATVRAGMHRLEPLDMAGASVGDFGTAVRDQGSIASCASFSFIGLVENQMFNDRGVSPDLSERFMIYSNFLQTGTLGGDPATIAAFPTATSNIGLLPEDAYPYAAVDANAARFDADAAQGLTTQVSGPMLADAIKDTAASSQARSEIITKPELVGALPAGPYPVKLPLKASRASKRAAFSATACSTSSRRWSSRPTRRSSPPGCPPTRARSATCASIRSSASA